MKKTSNIPNKIRDTIVILYEISILFIPFLFMYLAYKGIVTEIFAITGMFLYTLPFLSHGGVFGDKPKRFMDKIMGYEKVVVGEVESEEMAQKLIDMMTTGSSTETIQNVWEKEEEQDDSTKG